MSSPPDSKFSPAFQRLAWSNLFAQSAEQIGLAAAPIAAVLMLGAGAGETGVLAAVQSLPFLLLSFPAGVLADRASRRNLMIIAEALRAIAMLAVLALMLAGQLSIAALGFLGFVATTATIAFSVAAPSLVPALVQREDLAAANGRIELARSIAYASGPALAGAIAGWLGASAAFALTAIMSFVAIACLWRIAEPPRPAPAPRHFLSDLNEGARFALSHRLLRPILFTAIAWNTSWFILTPAYVPYAVETLHLDAAAIGTTLAGYGIGMVIAAYFSKRIIGAMPFGWAVLFGPIMSFAAALLMAATILYPSGLLAGLAFIVIGLGSITWVITTTTLRQMVTPHGLLGRLAAMFLTVNAGARPFGAALGALIGWAWGPGACIIAAAIGYGVQLAIIMASPVRELAQLPEGVIEAERA